jgi:hypothetical protein
MTRNNVDSPGDSRRGDPDAQNAVRTDEDATPTDADVEAAIEERDEHSDAPDTSGEIEPIEQFRESRRQRPRTPRQPLD